MNKSDIYEIVVGVISLLFGIVLLFLKKLDLIVINSNWTEKNLRKSRLIIEIGRSFNLRQDKNYKLKDVIVASLLVNFIFVPKLIAFTNTALLDIGDKGIQLDAFPL